MGRHGAKQQRVLGLAVSVVAGESIAGENNLGILRYLLVLPVGRTRLLLARLLTVTVFVFMAVIIVAVVAYVLGASLFGIKPLPGVSGATIAAKGAS